MKKIAKLSIASVVVAGLVVFVSGCASQPPNTANPKTQTGDSQTTAPVANAPRVLKDAMGNEVTIPAQPQRVIASYLEDHLVALGVKPVAQWSVGNSQVQGYLQKELAGIPAIPFDLPPEVVMSHNPDLIMMDSASLLQGDKYNQYAKIAPTFVIGKEKDSDWRKELLTVGEVLNKSEEAKKSLADYEAFVTESKQKLKQAIGEKSAAALWMTGKNVYVARQDLSSGDVLYKDLGFTVPAIVQEISKSGEANWNPISMEKLAELDAEYLFIVNSNPVAVEQLQKDPIWANIPAVKNGHAYTFAKDSSWLYTGVIANRQMIENVWSSVMK